MLFYAFFIEIFYVLEGEKKHAFKQATKHYSIYGGSSCG